jgi:mRNA interferase RelE/StbE
VLKGEYAGLRRIRVGNYRIVYEVQDRQLMVLVIRIGHRREVYR